MTIAWSSHDGHMNTIPQVQDLQEIPSFQEDQWLPANDYGCNDTTTNNNNNKQANKQTNSTSIPAIPCLLARQLAQWDPGVGRKIKG